MRARTVLLGLVLGLVAVTAQAGGWDLDWDADIPISGLLGNSVVINPCTDPPQLIEDWTGDHHMTSKWKKVTDDDGNMLGWEGHFHANHQNGGATGYDLVVDDNGDIVWEDGAPKKAVDEDGNFITTEYEIPGTYNWVQNLNENHKDGDHWSITEVFMCNLISHGSAGNGLIHFNGHTTMTEGGQIDVYTDNYWCKCAGAGPDKNGIVDCTTFMDFCQRPTIGDGPR